MDLSEAKNALEEVRELEKHLVARTDASRAEALRIVAEAKTKASAIVREKEADLAALSVSPQIGMVRGRDANVPAPDEQLTGGIAAELFHLLVKTD